VISDARQLLTISSNGTATQRFLSYAPVAVTPTAQTGSFAGSVRTDHLFIDTVSASLPSTLGDATPSPSSAEVDESMSGEIVTVGPINGLLGFDSFTSTAAFDIAAGEDAIALAALQPSQSAQSFLYQITTDSRFASDRRGQQLGPIGVPGTAPIRGLAIRVR
jgi:hypothetical protein